MGMEFESGIRTGIVNWAWNWELCLGLGIMP